MNLSKHILSAIYALICYLAGVASLIYFILFVNDLWLPKTVNTVVEDSSLLVVITMNILALSLFGLQHSVMARPAFKRRLTQVISPAIERSTYILATAVVIGLMCHLWIPVGPVVWEVQSDIGVWIVRGIALFGWAFLLLASFLLDHFELFGLSQGFGPLFNKKDRVVVMKEPGLYKIVRHPIQTGVLIGMWAVPVATLSHILFAFGMTLYIVIGLYFEEKDLVHQFGDAYVDYMKRVKRVIPFLV